MTQEELAVRIAEKILFSQISDIENLTVWEMTSDYIEYSDDNGPLTEYKDETKYDALCTMVFTMLDKATVGISWDEGTTWEW